ncbi:MAG TPA: SCO family protein [Thermoflexales bacterium]|nr:SCO family protein [Thermoflexales bacterium]HQW35870.1 SCO family protein [Thermoflexales bacterium]HQX75703.1 SCO family protein [Thermoflexales bacterium]HQZ23005.1 SCO family protein [Thermoflexales bacterium]HQZ99434.1 SCO family protein [Thermoflexales bacterium]
MPKSKKERIVFIILLAIGSFALGLMAVFVFAPPGAPQPSGDGLSGTLVNSQRQMPDFTLTNQDNQQMKLSDLRGKAVILFYGYLNCPDVCPLTLAEMKKTKELLGKDADKTAFVYISVDGERDTPDLLKQYLKMFDPAFIGLTGPSEQVRTIAFEYGAAFEKQKPPGTQAAYIVSHTAYTYLLDADGKWRMVFPYGVAPETVAAGVRSILR